MKLPAWLFPAATGAALLLTGPGGWSQTPPATPAGAPAAYQSDSSRAPIPVGSTMALYLYGSYAGRVSETQVGYQPNGNVVDSKGRLLGKLVDSAGRDITSPSVNGDYRLRGLDGTEIGTTVAPSSSAGVRSLTLRPIGAGWATPVAQNTTNGPVTADQGGTTTGSAISSSIRAGVGGGLSETDRNTSTGTSSNPDPNNQPGPSGPVYSTGGTVLTVPPSRSQTPNSSNPNPSAPMPAH